MSSNNGHELWLVGQVTQDLLPVLTAEDLVSMGITSLGPRRRILEAIAARTTVKSVHKQDLACASANVRSQQDVLDSEIPHRRRDVARPVHPSQNSFPVMLAEADKGKITSYFHRNRPSNNTPELPAKNRRADQDYPVAR